jgi:hypothetical protein
MPLIVGIVSVGSSSRPFSGTRHLEQPNLNFLQHHPENDRIGVTLERLSHKDISAYERHLCPGISTTRKRISHGDSLSRSDSPISSFWGQTFLLENIPFIDIPDAGIQDVHYYR